MQAAYIYSATSFSEVMKQLVAHRLTGVLTIRRRMGPFPYEASVTIVQGHAVRVRWGSYENEANESIMQWLNKWGRIYFMFHAHMPVPQLPPPSAVANPSQELPRSQTPPPPSQFPPPSITRPLPQVSADGSNKLTISPEVNVPVLTTQARNYLLTNLPRYDRTIFLLINGQRTIAELAYLTKRSAAEVYASLHRLRELQLVEVVL